MIEKLGDIVSSRLASRSGGSYTSIEVGNAVASLLTRCIDVANAREGISTSSDARRQVDLVGNHKGSGSREKELVGGDRDIVRLISLRRGSSGRDIARGHVVSVDFSALDVMDEAVGGVDGGVDSRNSSSVSEGASETVVTSGSGEVREAAGSSGGPSSIIEVALGPGVGSLGNIGVLPLREGGGEDRHLKGLDHTGRGSSKQVRNVAPEDSGTAEVEGEVGSIIGRAPAITVGILHMHRIEAVGQADVEGLVGVVGASSMGEERVSICGIATIDIE